MAGLGVTVVIGGVLFTQRRAPPPPPPEPPPEPAVVPPTTVSIEASDAPDELVLTVDGKAAHLPLTLPRSSDIHTLVFAARGFQERTLKVDASTSRMLTLAMQPEVAPVEPPPRIHEPTDQPPPVRKKRREVPPNILNAGRKL